MQHFFLYQHLNLGTHRQMLEAEHSPQEGYAGGPQWSGVGRRPCQPWEGIQGTAMPGTGGVLGGLSQVLELSPALAVEGSEAGGREGSRPRRRTKWEQPRRLGRGAQGTRGLASCGARSPHPTALVRHVGFPLGVSETPSQALGQGYK